ncbi:hypothetical protein LguiB_023398 [Lonicera macranthoides]
MTETYRQAGVVTGQLLPAREGQMGTIAEVIDRESDEEIPLRETHTKEGYDLVVLQSLLGSTTLSNTLEDLCMHILHLRGSFITSRLIDQGWEDFPTSYAELMGAASGGAPDPIDKCGWYPPPIFGFSGSHVKGMTDTVAVTSFSCKRSCIAIYIDLDNHVYQYSKQLVFPCTR